MGSPTELAEQARRTHQTKRRMLAGAAGGILATPGAYIVGSIAGWVTTLPVTGTALFVIAGYDKPDFFIENQLGSLAEILALGAACFYASRTGVRVFAGISRRRPTILGVGWAIIGTPIVAALALFVIRVHQSWPTFVAELLVPVAFAAGALLLVGRSMRRLPFPGRAIAALLVAASVVGLVAGPALVSASGSRFADVTPRSPVDAEGSPLPGYSRPVLSVDTAGPWPMAVVSTTQWIWSALWLSDDPSTGELTAFFALSTATGGDPLPGWSDIRFEVWPGIWVQNQAEGDVVGIAAGATAPILTAPGFRVASPIGPRWPDEIHGTVAMGMRRDGPIWFVMLTGVAPDGIRYRLSKAVKWESDSYGTAWDWLTAPG
jgi:hypothetical protein